MKRYTLHALVVLNLALIATLSWLWFDETGQPRGIHWTPPVAVKPDFSTKPRSSSPASSPEMSWMIATLERPLFSPSRRPPPPVVTTSAPEMPPPDPLANVLIQGVYAGDEVGGIIARVDGVPKRISINESIGGWTLKGIDERNVKFVRSNETRIVQLQRAKDAPPPTTNTTASGPASGLPTGAPQAMAAGNAAAQAAQEAVRDRYRRRNEVRARAGLPPVELP